MSGSNKQPFWAEGLGDLALGGTKVIPGYDSAASGLASAASSASEDRASLSAIEWCRGQALDIVAEVADAISDGNLAEDQLPSDLLDSLMLDAIDQDGEMDEDADKFASAIGEAIGDALSSLGVDDQTIEDIFSDDVTVADSALESAASTIIANLPDAGDPLDSFVQEFIYGSPDADSDEAGFDSATGKKLTVGKNSTKKVNGKTIRYKAIKAIRNGHVKVVNKRLKGQSVRLTAQQRAAIKKAGRKALTGNAIRKRVRSLAKGKKVGLY